MATLAVNPDEVRLVAVDEPIRPAVANAPIQKGQAVSPNANGRMDPGGAAVSGIAITRAVAAKYEVSVLKRGIVELGDAIQDLAYGASVYAAPNGTLDDAATGNVRVGTVIEGWNDRTPRKLLRVER